MKNIYDNFFQVEPSVEMMVLVPQWSTEGLCCTASSHHDILSSEEIIGILGSWIKSYTYFSGNFIPTNERN